MIRGSFTVTRDGFRMTWLVSSLVEASAALPVEMVPVDSLAHHLNVHGWFGAGEVTPEMIAEHWKRLANADLRYPIILSHEYGLMDGAHRLLRACAVGVPTISCVTFTVTPQPDSRVAS